MSKAALLLSTYFASININSTTRLAPPQPAIVGLSCPLRLDLRDPTPSTCMLFSIYQPDQVNTRIRNAVVKPKRRPNDTLHKR